MDDKAISPVGKPGIPKSTGVRKHNKVLTPADGLPLECTAHDFHVGDIVPSVCPRFLDIAKISFSKGKIHV